MAEITIPAFIYEISSGNGRRLQGREGYTHRAEWLLNEKILETTQPREKKIFKETAEEEAREELSS